MPAVAFLEAPCRSQELITLKWVLRSSGYEIASTWHDAPPTASFPSQVHWTSAQMEQMTPFDTIVILWRAHEEIPAQLALTVGFAIARNLEVIWIGTPLEPLSQFRNVHCFASVEAFQRHLLLEEKTRAESPARARRAA
jgi:hypothetical protein